MISSLEKGPAAKSVRLKLPRFTVVGATTRLALSAPLRARFGAVYRMDYYDEGSLAAIIQRGAGLLQVPFEEDGVHEIARRARGTPRIALRLLRRVRDFADVRAQGTITMDVAKEGLGMLNIDSQGWMKWTDAFSWLSLINTTVDQ